MGLTRQFQAPPTTIDLRIKYRSDGHHIQLTMVFCCGIDNARGDIVAIWRREDWAVARKIQTKGQDVINVRWW
jgi:hypothetical protein